MHALQHCRQPPTLSYGRVLCRQAVNWLFWGARQLMGDALLSVAELGCANVESHEAIRKRIHFLQERA